MCFYLVKKPFVSTVQCQNTPTCTKNSNLSEQCIICSAQYVDKCQPSCSSSKNNLECSELHYKIEQLNKEVKLTEEMVTLKRHYYVEY